MISTRASGDVLANPLGQPHHGQALARALVCQMMPPSRLPTRSCAALHAEILVVAAGLLHAGVEDHEVVDDLQEARLGAQLGQRAVQRVLNCGSDSFQAS